MFINYDPLTGVSINTFRKPSGYYNDDVIGFIEDVLSENPSCCPLDGTLDAIQDGEVLSRIKADQNELQTILEDISNSILESING